MVKPSKDAYGNTILVTTAPQTGDTANNAIALMMVGAAGLALILRKRRAHTCV